MHLNLEIFPQFSPAGFLPSLKVCRDLITHRPRGFAYLNFQNPSDAERALDTMSFDMLKGRPVHIMSSTRDPSLRRSGVGNIFIKNLDGSIDNKAMYDTFSAYGSILSCEVATDADGVSNGYDFVQFENEAAANNAIENVNGLLLNNKKVFVGKFVPRADFDPDFGNVYIKNFTESMTDDALMKLFEKFGTITSCRVDYYDVWESKVGLVSFEKPEQAEGAVAEMNGVKVDSKVLYVGRALWYNQYD